MPSRLHITRPARTTRIEGGRTSRAVVDDDEPTFHVKHGVPSSMAARDEAQWRTWALTSER